MSPLSDEAPLTLDRPDLVHGVREVLDRVGFDPTHIPEQCGVKNLDQVTLNILDRPRLLWRTRDGGPLSALIRLFLVGDPVEIDASRRAIEPMDPADWAALGLIKLEGTTARRSFFVRPFGSLMLAYDHAHPSAGQRRDHVLGVTGTTLYLANATVRPPSRRTLDLGTGSGYQAFLAAVHSQHVLATDRNPRAVNVTRFNALLNRITNVEAVVSDLFESIEGPPFDLIVSNPPFVVSPDNFLQFRDSGLEGDEISQRLLRRSGSPGRGGLRPVPLRPGCGSPERTGRSGWSPGSTARDAMPGSSTIPARSTSTPITGSARETFPTQCAWLRRLTAGWPITSSIGSRQSIPALVTLRRRSTATNWIRFEDNRPTSHANGVGIQAVFAAHDLLERHGSDQALLNLRLRCRPELRMVQKLEPSDSGWLVESAQCMLGKGLEFEGRLDQAMFHVLTLCRGKQPLSAVLAQAAARTGQGLDQIAPGCLATVRSLIDQGFLWPVDEHSGAS